MAVVQMPMAPAYRPSPRAAPVGSSANRPGQLAGRYGVTGAGPGIGPQSSNKGTRMDASRSGRLSRGMTAIHTSPTALTIW
jgi:hypothetical protein